jgi:cytochrome c oxidase assembly protein subunit 15
MVMASDIVFGAQSASTPSTAASPANRRLVAYWLFAVCAMIWVMVGIGGYTRDAGAGLSIMDWQPIIGILPPLSDDAWNRVFALYQTIPQYHIEHQGMDLAGFKTLFWPEYLHRLWGRLIGFVFFVPLVAFIATGRIEKRLIPWLALLFVLGGLQGAIGWFMVASGFDPNSVAVEPWRLSLHFSAAMFLYAAVLWTGMTVLRPQAFPVPGAVTLKWLVVVLIVCIAVTMVAGTFVSGTEADDINKTWPLIEGHWVPPDANALQPGWLNMFANKAVVQWDHRILGTFTALSVFGTVFYGLLHELPRRVRLPILLLAMFAMLQWALGITALVSDVANVGLIHQLNAVLLLTAAFWSLHELRGAHKILKVRS